MIDLKQYGYVESEISPVGLMAGRGRKCNGANTLKNLEEKNEELS